MPPAPEPFSRDSRTIMNILIIDDEASLRRSLGAFLEDMDYDHLEASNGMEGLSVLRSGASEVDAVMVDLNMPVMDGYTFIEHASQEFPDIPLIVISGVGVVEDAIRAVQIGGWDFITKPIHNMDIVEHILSKALERARLRQENKAYQENLEHLVRRRTRQLDTARRQVMQRLSRAAEYKDNETGRHVIRVGEISALLGKALGLSENQCEILRECAPLHDIGKIGIPDAILLKPGKLDAQEWGTMKRHALFGYEILGPLSLNGASGTSTPDRSLLEISDDEDNDFLKTARLLALCHHERVDGQGYPLGLQGDEIPLQARIVALVDVFDALRSRRSYKEPFPFERCCEIIRQSAGTQFDTDVVEAFFNNTDAILSVYEKWGDES